ncbi:MAG TPA: hypothetical protein VK753_10865 [Xanthomonadaceae bacterium]|jgi:hypothetical protein|nr:hypothetical protein [Xanthomonadaceae bacterium]
MRTAFATGFLLLGAVFCGRSSAEEPANLNSAVRHFLHVSATPHFRYGLADLDFDGVDDAVVLIQDRRYCSSGGCPMLVFHGTREGFKPLSSSTIANEPIRVSIATHYGWKILIFTTAGRGAALLRFDGSRYSRNPSVQTKASASDLSVATTLALQDVAKK